MKDSEFFKAPLPLSDLFAMLEERYPGIKQRVLRSCAVTVNLEYVDVEMNGHSIGDHEQAGGVKGLVIQAGNEVAIIPPVSSG